MINVVNKRTHSSTFDDIYIGRGSIFGNPYTHLNSNHSQVKQKVNSREESILKYKDYFGYKIRSRDVEFCNTLNELLIKKLLGQDINLVCFCAPSNCHGDIIKEYLDSEKYCLNWFSNMTRLDTPFSYGEMSFYTVENFYQAMKSKDKNTRILISKMNPFESKKYWLDKKLDNENFHDQKIKIMKYALKRKFAKGTSWREKLDSTEGSEIVEWNNWRDKFWGKSIFDNEGENNLGKLLMEIRDS